MARPVGSKAKYGGGEVATRAATPELKALINEMGEYSLQFISDVVANRVTDGEGEHVEVPLPLRLDAAKIGLERWLGKVQNSDPAPPQITFNIGRVYSLNASGDQDVIELAEGVDYTADTLEKLSG